MSRVALFSRFMKRSQEMSLYDKEKEDEVIPADRDKSTNDVSEAVTRLLRVRRESKLIEESKSQAEADTKPRMIHCQSMSMSKKQEARRLLAEKREAARQKPAEQTSEGRRLGTCSEVPLSQFITTYLGLAVSSPYSSIPVLEDTPRDFFYGGSLPLV